MCLCAALSSSIVSQKQVTKISLLKRMFLELVFHFGLGVEQVDLLIKTMGYDAAFNYKEESDFSAALKKYAPDLLLALCKIWKFPVNKSACLNLIKGVWKDEYNPRTLISGLVFNHLQICQIV
jgi:hypothetical protein